MHSLRLLFLSTLLALSFSALAQVYKSIDADGNVVFSDQPPSPDAKKS
jgi:hypothetical protein